MGHWFDTTGLDGEGRFAAPLPRRARASRLRRFAEANGLEVDLRPTGEIPSLVFGPRAAGKDIVVSTCEPRVEFGNYGAKYFLGSDDKVPSRQGRISVRHGLALPHVLLNFAGGMGARTAFNVTSAALRFLQDFSETATESDLSEFKQFRIDGTLVSDGLDVGVFAAPGHEESGRALLTPPVIAIMADLASSFAVEVRGEWMTAYSFYGDVSTTDADVWAWVFSSASRMIDLAQVWRCGWPPVQESAAVAPLDLGEIPFYAPQRVPRPGKIDGVFSKASLARLKRDR